MKKYVLVTGGLGFIGSHTVVELLEEEEEVIILDNLSNSELATLEAIKALTKKEPKFFSFDVADPSLLHRIFESYPVESVIHFAGHKAVGESVLNPLEYYRNNLSTTLNLLETMSQFDVKKIIFSSSATVYDHQFPAPFSEQSTVGNCTNPYGWSKLMNEQILSDYEKSIDQASIVLLRYFNPVGSHPSGLLGEKPKGIPNNLMPYIVKVAKKEIEYLSVFGSDYPTPDGTGIRDYIHVVDLAKGHLAALKFLRENTGCEVFNLGSGVGYSVLEMVREFERVNKVTVPYVLAQRRSGDVAISYAETTKAEKVLKWNTKKDLTDICIDSWRAG